MNANCDSDRIIWGYMQYKLEIQKIFQEIYKQRYQDFQKKNHFGQDWIDRPIKSYL